MKATTTPAPRRAGTATAFETLHRKLHKLRTSDPRSHAAITEMIAVLIRNAEARDLRRARKKVER